METIINGDNNQKLMSVLDELAKSWGASPLYVDIYPERSEVIFWLNEHGEEFPTCLTFAQLEKEFGLTKEDILNF